MPEDERRIEAPHSQHCIALSPEHSTVVELGFYALLACNDWFPSANRAKHAVVKSSGCWQWHCIEVQQCFGTPTDAPSKCAACPMEKA